MNLFPLDLVGDYSVNIGSTYSITIQLCNAPDLMLYTGYSQIRQNNTSETVILEPTITVLNKDIFKLEIPYTAFPTDILAGNYQYDVMFANATDRFFAIGGKVTLIKRITQLL